MIQVLVDSSGFLALLNRQDPAHPRAKQALLNLQKEGVALFSTNFIKAEAHALLGSRLGWNIARNWLEAFDLPTERVLPDDEAKAHWLILNHQNKTYSFVDATSFAVMERLRIRTAFTLDSHFRQAGFETAP